MDRCRTANRVSDSQDFRRVVAAAHPSLLMFWEVVAGMKLCTMHTRSAFGYLQDPMGAFHEVLVENHGLGEALYTNHVFGGISFDAQRCAGFYSRSIDKSSMLDSPIDGIDEFEPHLEQNEWLVKMVSLETLACLPCYDSRLGSARA